MTQNIGTIDRVIRIAIAINLCYLFLSGTYTDRTTNALLLFVAVVLAINSVTRVSILYTLFGWYTDREMTDD
jgi:hypothetical protein